MSLTVEPLSAQNWAALEDLFGPTGASSGCWCMWPRIGPSYWRRSHEENRRELHRSTWMCPTITRNTFQGIAATFSGHGFVEVSRRKVDRPVMRRTLTS